MKRSVFLLLLLAQQAFADCQITWDVPTETVVGTPITWGPLQYRLHWGTESGNYTNTAIIDHGPPTTCSELIEQGLRDGTYYFAITALSSNGSDNAFSNEVLAENVFGGDVFPAERIINFEITVSPSGQINGQITVQ